jgi:PAS domain S-box-containing protein
MPNDDSLGDLAPALQAHRDQLAQAWYRAIAQTGYTALDNRASKERFTELVDRLIRLLTAPEISETEAKAIGETLVDFHYLDPDTLGKTLEVLYRHFITHVPAGKITVLNRRLHTIVSGLASGYIKRSRVTVLREQEAIIQALVSQLSEQNEALSRAQQTLETRVNERTRELAQANERLREEITRRQQAEDAYQTLADNSLQALFIYQDDKVAFINEASSQMTGYDVNELKAMTISDLVAMIHPEDRATIETLYHGQAEAPHATTTERLEYRFYHKNGTLHWAEVFASKVEYQGEPAFQAVIIDITERKRAEEEYRKSEERYRNLFDTSPDLMVAHVNNIVTTANPAAAKMLQAPSRDDLIGRDAIELAHPDYRATHRSRLQRLLEGKPIPPLEIQMPQDGADPIELELRTVLLENQEESPTVLVVGRDITKRKRAEAQLSKSYDELEVRVQERTRELASTNARLKDEIAERVRAEQALRRSNEELKIYNAIATQSGQGQDLDLLFDNLLEEIQKLIKAQVLWISLHDPGEDKSSMNAAAQKPAANITKRERELKTSISEAVLMQGTSELIAISPKADLPYVLRNLEVGDTPIDALGLPIRVQQRTIGVLGLILPNREDHQAPRDAALTPQDVQFLKTIAAQISMTAENTHLTRMAAEVELLKASADMRSDLISNFTHDLKTPLGIIKMSSTTLLRDDVEFDQETQKEFLTDIDMQTDTLNTIVNRVLELDRLESDGLQLHRDPTDLAELTEEILTSMRLGLNGHELSMDFPDEPLVAHVDARYVKEVLNNLLDNAIKYSPQGGEITVRGRHKGDHVTISIDDHGIGIPQDEMERVFERFYRVNNAVTHDTSGFGLGLSVCRGIVEAHGGKIWAESTLGQGTTFSFTLPAMM